MYEEIINALETKFNGVQKSILERIARKLATTTKNADEVQTVVDGVSFQQVLESYGDSRATDATKTAVLNYEKKHNIKDGKPVVDTTDAPHDTTTTTEDAPTYVKDLLKSVEALTKTVAEMKGAELTKIRKQKLADVLQDLPELNRKGYERISLESLKDDEFDNLLSEITTEVGELAKQQNVKGAVFGKPTVQGSSTGKGDNQQKPSKEETDAVIARMNI